MTTRREIFDRLKSSASGLYDEQEAVSIAHIVMEDMGGVSRLSLALEPDAPMAWSAPLERAAEEIGCGRPVQYITGRAFFRGLAFSVGEGVLIPRPETEELVEWIIRESGGAQKILDIGTGSGAIAVSLAAVLPGAVVTATDISQRALKFARENARRHQVDVRFVQADILAPERSEETFDLIVSNPPYIPRSEAAAMHGNVTEYEPPQALFVEDGDPALFYRAIALFGHRALAANGTIYFEIHENFAPQVVQTLSREGYADIEVRRDINGRERMVKCRKR